MILCGLSYTAPFPLIVSWLVVSLCGWLQSKVLGWNFLCFRSDKRWCATASLSYNPFLNTGENHCIVLCVPMSVPLCTWGIVLLLYIHSLINGISLRYHWWITDVMPSIRFVVFILSILSICMCVVCDSIRPIVFSGKLMSCMYVCVTWTYPGVRVGTCNLCPIVTLYVCDIRLTHHVEVCGGRYASTWWW